LTLELVLESKDDGERLRRVEVVVQRGGKVGARLFEELLRVPRGRRAGPRLEATPEQVDPGEGAPRLLDRIEASRDAVRVVGDLEVEPLPVRHLEEREAHLARPRARELGEIREGVEVLQPLRHLLAAYEQVLVVEPGL